MHNIEGKNKFSIAGLIAASTATASGLGILYVYAYSISLDCDLLQYFGPTDYFKIAIQWVPPLMLGLLAGVVLIGRSALNKLKVTRSDLRRRRTEMLLVPSLLVLCAILPTILDYVGIIRMDRRIIYPIWTSAGVAVCTFGSLIYLARRDADSTGEPFAGYRFVILVAPALLVGTFFIGLSNAELLKERTSQAPKTKITLSELPPVEGQIIFLLERYVVFLKHNERAISAIPTKLITLIQELPNVKSGSR